MDIAGAPCVRDGCRAASDAIARTSLAVTSFVREVRESRSEFDAISTELHSLDGVLDLLASDAAFLPAPLAEQTPRVLEQCLALTDELEGCVSVLNRPGVTRADKKSRWWASRGHIDKLRSTLAEYKLVLGLAVDMVAVLKPQTGNSDDPPQMQDDELVDDASGEDGGLAMVAAQIAKVTNNLHKDFQVNAALAQLGQFLDVLQLQAEAAQDPIESEPSDRHCDRSSSLSGSPDSAIDVSCDNLDAAPVFVSKQTIPLSSADIPREAWQGETGEFVGELREMPPPLPPRSASRLSTVLPGCHALPPPHTADNYSAPRAVAPLRGLKMGSAVQTQDPVQRPDRADSYSPPLEVAPLRSSRDSYYTPVTELPELVEDSSTEPESRTLSRRSSMLGNMLYSVWDPPHADLPSPGRPITSSGDGRGVHRPSSLLRRSSSRLSNTLRNLGRKRPSLGTIDDKAEAEPTDVFGVPLTKSMQVAKGIASTRHGGGGSSVRATREYPLCVLRCVYHIRDCGLDEPDIFGLDGHQLRLPQLKTVFASVETGYGKELDWSRFTVYDAADLILLFLSELPQPLVPESVGKRWISLSRQASIRTARLDQGLDFWEEAFMGIRGHGRALFKLLLNLWGDIADAAEVNGMTAERLAGRVIRPLMHAVPGRDHTDLMLGLAFVIRKRSEYNLAINGVSRRSNAAF